MVKLAFCPRERESQKKTLAEEIKRLLIDFSDESVEDVRLKGGKMGIKISWGLLWLLSWKKDKSVNYSTKEVGTYLGYIWEIIQ